MPSRRKPGDGSNYNYVEVAMPCPDNYYYKKGQAEVEYWDKSSGYLGFPEFVVIWDLLEISYARQAIQSFNDNLASGSWNDFALLSPYDYSWVNTKGVVLKPTLAGIKGEYVKGFTLHFVQIGAFGLQPSSDEGSVDQQFSYGGGTQVVWHR